MSAGNRARAGAVADGWRLAFGTLTVIPVRPPGAVDKAAARVAMTVAPLAVFPVTLAATLVGAALAGLGLPPLASGLVVVGALALGTRFVHADGLADTADGLGSSWDRDRALEVMRKGDVGPMGATTLVLVLGIQAACAGTLLQAPQGWAAVAIALAGSRAALALGTRRGVPAARPEGLGEAVAGAVPAARCAAVWGVALLAGASVEVATGGHWARGALAALGGGVAAWCVLAWVCRKLGGITGDVLGCAVEVAATAWMVGLSLH